MSAPCPLNDLVGKVRHARVGDVQTVDATAQIDTIVMKQRVTRNHEHICRPTCAGEDVYFVHAHLIDQRRYYDTLGALAERKDGSFSACLQQRRQIEALHLADGGILAVVGPLEPEEDVAEHEHGWWTAHLAS